MVGSAAALLLHSGVAMYRVYRGLRSGWRAMLLAVRLTASRAAIDRTHASSQLPHPPLHTTMPPLCCS